MHYMDAKRMEKKLDSNYIRIAARCIEQVLEATAYKTAAVRPPTIHHENYPS